MTLPETTRPTRGVPIAPPTRQGRVASVPVGIRALLTSQYIGVLGVLVIAVVVLALTQPLFLTADNFVNIASSQASLLVVAVGLTFVMLVGGIDLSIGGVMALGSIALWAMLGAGAPPVVAALLVVAGGLVVGGSTNGGLIGVAGLSFLVVTIGSASVFRGLANVWSGGQSQTVYTHSWLVKLGSGTWAGLPYLVWISMLVFAVSLLVLRYSGYGRMIYATGGNPEAARLAGIPTAAIRVSVYTISGGLAALAALMDTSRLTSANPNAGLGIELTAGAAVLLGGTSFMGGRGSVVGTLLGVLFLGVLSNGLVLAGISSFWGAVVSGAVLIVAIGIDRLRAGGGT
ncbi:ABC transporter permease [Micromonospora marina]|uniref:ABC transporter permease n=1 Tax=Micromonospora marina TaxID=307120 RepID=UPI00345457E5